MCGNLLPCCTLSVCLNIQTLRPLLAKSLLKAVFILRRFGGSGEGKQDPEPSLLQYLSSSLISYRDGVDPINLCCESQASVLQYLATLFCIEHDLT